MVKKSKTPRVPLALPRAMIERGMRGADKLTDILRSDQYDDDTIFLLYFGNLAAAQAVWERVCRYEIAFSPALRRAIEKWKGFNEAEFRELVNEERNTALHQGTLPTLHWFDMLIEEDGEEVARPSHWFKKSRYRSFEFNIFFGEWLMDVWVWWSGRINQLERMYGAEMKQSGVDA